jgi:hypothetical protein
MRRDASYANWKKSPWAEAKLIGDPDRQNLAGG